MKRLLLAVAALPLAALAQSVSLAGVMGGKALFVVDGQTQMLAVGESAHGIRLLRLQGDQAQIERAGVVSLLQVGGAPAKLAGGAAADAGGREVVIPAGPGGHFVVGGAINGRAVRFMVDTGATLVALGQAEAARIGLDWRGGQRTLIQTANGAVPATLLTLSSVRVGDVEVANVPAIVVPAAMPMVLLGNSFLSRMQMRRENDVMRLELRP